MWYPLEELVPDNFLKPCACGCDELIWDRDKEGRTKYYAYKHRHYKGGKTKMNNYIYILINSKYIGEHRLIWEQEHNACLLAWSDIHHKDHNSSNNVWYNLQAMTASQHQSVTHKGSTTSLETKKKISIGVKRHYNTN